MSDLSMYELEDIIWDEFDQTDDHIVPHCSDEHASEQSLQSDSLKKPRREVTNVSSNASNGVGREKEERDPTTYNKKRNMLEKDSSPDKPDVFSALRDTETTMKEMSNDVNRDNEFSANDVTTTSSSLFKKSNDVSIDNEFSANEPVLNDKSTAVNRDSYDYSLGHISQKDDLSFFDNDCEDRESSELLYYNWPDMGNFEDVDKMLRSCDSSFGLGITSNADGLGITSNTDELGWFSSSGPIEDSVESLKSDFNFPGPLSSALKSISEDHEPPKLNKDEFKPLEQGVDSRGVPFRTAANEHTKKDNKMVNLHKKQSKHQNTSEGKRKGQWIDSGSSFYSTVGPQNNDEILSSVGTTEEVFTSTGNRQQRQSLEPGSFHYLQNRVPYVFPDYSHAPVQATGGPSLSRVKVENQGLISLSSKESSYGSNQLQSIDNSGYPPFDVTSIKLDEKKEKVHHPGFEPSFTGSTRNVSMMVQPSICDPTPFQKQVHQSASQSDVEGAQVGGFREIGAQNVPESTSMNSVLDESSLEATSFRQLEQVMEQLDLRTKLCIRDSLYRLARSAEQRHNYANMGDGSMIVEGTNECTGFMDMETDTNPIDRCIAHLLFHRPSETHGMPVQNPLPHKSNPMIGSITSPPLMAENLVCQEERVVESDDKMADYLQRG